MAIAVGALLDGIPQSIVIGVSLISGGAVSWVTVAAVFLSNLPKGLSSAAGMKKAGRSPQRRELQRWWVTLFLDSFQILYQISLVAD